MSVAFYNGFRFRTTDLARIHAELHRLRPEVLRLAEDRFATWLATNAVRILDRATIALAVGDDPRSDLDPINSPLSLAWAEYERRITEVERRRIRDPDVDFSMTVTR